MTTKTQKIESIENEYEKLKKVHDTKSGIIRALDALGFKRADIARVMNIRYQHVRNVLITPLKKKQ